jgi:hypothetical protein
MQQEALAMHAGPHLFQEGELQVKSQVPPPQTGALLAGGVQSASTQQEALAMQTAPHFL